MLLFYRRLFPSNATNAIFRVAWVIVAFLGVGTGIGTLVAAICNCNPLVYYLDRDLAGKCPNLRSLLVSSAALNIVTDVSILILPTLVVWRLQVTKSQKLAVSGIFLLDGLYVLVSENWFTDFRWQLLRLSSVCIASIVRLLYLSRVGYADSTCTSTFVPVCPKYLG